MADGYEDLREDELPGPAYEGYESAELACPAERSGHVAVSDGRHMFVWGGYKSNQVRGLYDFYLPREELWIYNMETGRWKLCRVCGQGAVLVWRTPFKRQYK